MLTKNLLIIGGIAVVVGILFRTTLSGFPGFKSVYLAVNPSGVNKSGA